MTTLIIASKSDKVAGKEAVTWPSDYELNTPSASF